MARRFALAALAVLTLTPSRSPAASYTVGARTEVELYDLRSIAGRDPLDPLAIQRQRLVQYLQLGAFDLGSRGPRERVDFVTSLRLDEDFGLTARERELLDLTQPRVDLLYAYLQWHGAFDGLLDARLGRQVVLSEVEFWSFDGLQVTVHVPHVHVAATAFGGLLDTGSSPLGSATFAPDGVRTSDRARIADGASTFLEGTPTQDIAYDYLDAPEPVFGARLDLEGVPDVGASVGYRRVISDTSGADLQHTAAALRGWQVVLEHLTADASWRPLSGFSIQAAADQDLVRQRPAYLSGAARYEIVPYRLTGALAWALYNPSLSSDSIWNVFATGSRQEWQLRFDWLPPGRFRTTAGVLATGYGNDLNPAFFPDTVAGATDWMPGGFAGVSTRPGRRVRLGADVSYRGVPGAKPGNDSYLGSQLFVTGVAGYDWVVGWNAVDLQLSLANVNDPNQVALRDLWSTSLALLSRNRLTREAEILIIGEGSVNRYSQPDLRAYAALELEADFR